MASGFLELEGGTQPALPSGGRSRIWFDSTENTWKLLRADGSNQKIALPLPTQVGQVPIWNGTEWVAGRQDIDFKHKSEFLEDWGGNGTVGVFNWDTDQASGGNVSSTQTFPISTDKAYGRIRYRTTALSSASRAGHDRGAPECSLGGGAIVVVNSNWFPTEWTNAANNCRFLTGLGALGSDATGGGQNDGVYFRILGNEVFAVCEDGGVQTSVLVFDSLLSERWYRFHIEVNASGDTASFQLYETYQDGTPPALRGTATITTNLPPATANVGPFNLFNRTAAGAQQVDMFQDYFYFKKEYSFER